MAVGFALLLPMISLPTWRHPGSKTAYSRPMLAPGTVPGPPTRAAPTFERMLPYKFPHTITSNWPGLETSYVVVVSATLEKRRTCIDALSTIMSSVLIPKDSYRFPTARQVFKNKPSPSFLSTRRNEYD